MSNKQKQLGRLTSRLAEALDDLALAVENYRYGKLGDAKLAQATEITAEAIRKAQQQSRR